MQMIETVAELEAIYGVPVLASTGKVADHVTDEYGRIIEAAPFCALATVGPEGLDCSPRGDAFGLTRIQDRKTLLLPDRRGNNRIDSIRNMVRDPRVALMYLVPGSGNALRVNGRAKVTADQALRETFSVEGALPRTVAVITVDEIYFQCARAIVRSRLWDPASQALAKDLPTPGQILQSMTRGEIQAEPYDTEWPQRAAATMW
jgi:PPOX class probable FMN-dependent enzyme